MKKDTIIQSLVIMTITLFSTSIYAGTASFSDKETTCLLFNNDILQHKSVCTYSGTSGGGVSYVVYERQFILGNKRSYDVIDGLWLEGFHDENSAINEKSTTTLNNVIASRHYRDSATLQRLNDATADKYMMNLNNSDERISNIARTSLLRCYTTVKHHDEFCYVENFDLL